MPWSPPPLDAGLQPLEVQRCREQTAAGRGWPGGRGGGGGGKRNGMTLGAAGVGTVMLVAITALISVSFANDKKLRDGTG